MGTSFPALFETPWISLHSPTPLWSLLLKSYMPRQLLWSLNVMMSEYILQLTKALRKQIVFTASVCSLTFKCEAIHCYVYISFSEQSSRRWDHSLRQDRQPVSATYTYSIITQTGTRAYAWVHAAFSENDVTPLVSCINSCVCLQVQAPPQLKISVDTSGVFKSALLYNSMVSCDSDVNNRPH